MTIRHLLAGVAVAASIAASAHAATTFAGFTESDDAANITWTETGSAGGTLTASAPIEFAFNAGAATTTPFLATLTLTAASTVAATDTSGTITQGGIDGSFTISTASPVSIGGSLYTGDLLSGAFTGGEIIGPDGGTTTSIQDGFSTGSVSFTSTLPPTLLSLGLTGNGFSFSGTSLSALALTGDSPGSFSGVFSGDFQTDAGGVIGGGSGVPEPASWALMLLGVGVVGGVSRRKRAGVSQVA
jgi:hypothetical protein